MENVYNTWGEGVEKTTDCMTIWTRGYLHDSSCTEMRKFVCEKDPNTSRFEEPRNKINFKI